MTTQTQTHAEQPADAAPSPAGALPPPAERGQLVLASAVIEKIAAQLVTDAPGVGGTRSGFMGFGGSEGFGTRPKVSAALSGQTAAITAHIGLAYPAHIRTVTEELRQLLMREVTRLTGVDVRQVDIHVDWLRPDTESHTGRRLT